MNNTSMLSLVESASVAGTSSFWQDPINHPATPLYAVLALLVLVTLVTAMVAVTLLRVLNTLTEQMARDRAELLGKEYVEEPGWWTRLDRRLTGAVPIEKEATIELEHNYDGIKELDNHLPPWWKWLFYATIVWSGVYLVIYHVTDAAPLMEQEYADEMTLAQEAARKRQTLQPVASIDEAQLVYTRDEQIIAKGLSLYKGNCASCHKDNGEGGIGPNLTDDYWLHGGGIKDVYATIKNGVPEKGMISWKTILKPEDIRDVAFFILSLQGTNPANAKAPQGVRWEEVPTVKADSASVSPGQ